MDDVVPFLTAKATTPLPSFLVREIKQRLGPNASATNAIESREPAGVVLTPENKSDVLAVLQEILGSDGIDELGEEGMTLRHEPMDDLGLLP